MKHATLFLDESGKASLTDNKFDQFLITGVIIDDENIHNLEVIFNFLKKKYNINSDIPFHAYDMLENTTSKISDPNIKKLIVDISSFIAHIPLKIKLIYLSKSDFKSAIGITSNSDFSGHSKRKSLREAPYHVIACNMFKWFTNYLKNKNSIGQVLTDARVGGDYELLTSLNSCKQTNNIYPDNISSHIKSRCTAICFADKTFLSGGLEIADLISYVSFFKIRNMLTGDIKKNYNPLWQQIEKNLERGNIKKISKKEIRKFYKLRRGEIHKYLNITV